MRKSAVLVISSLILAAGFMYAAAGAPDQTFGHGGKVQTSFTNFSSNGAVAKGAVLQSDGKIVIAAVFLNTTMATEAAGLVRYLPNGSLDTTFGQSGVTMVAFTNFINTPNSIALQPDGKVLIAGEASSADGTTSEFALARFNTDGSLDAGFGKGGKVITNFVGVQPGGVSNPANVVVLQLDNKIIAAGSASQCGKCNHDTALARYNANGSLDATFGTRGTVRIKVSAGPPNALAILTNGHILALSGTAIEEFNSSGTLQSAVTGGTLAAASTGGTNLFQPDGRFLAAQGVPGDNRHDGDIKVLRFEPTGDPDRSFNSPVFEVADAADIQPNGNIVLGAQPDSIQTAATFGVSRLNADGSLDSSFGNGGAVNTQFPGANTSVATILVQPDGKIVVIGNAIENATGNADLVLARYLGQ